MKPVLIVRKTSNLEQHGHEVSSQSRILVEQLSILNKAHEEHYQCLTDLRELLTRYEIPFVELHRDQVPFRDGSKDSPSNYSAIITVGGDGTLLSLIHHIKDESVPVIGIRSSSESVGYLCAGGQKELSFIVSALAGKSLVFQSRQRLLARVHRAVDHNDILSYPVLNDFLYTNANPASTTRYLLRYGSQTEVQKSSGLWISTAAGSTAGISAAGGLKQASDDRKFQFVVRELYETARKSNLKMALFDPDQEELVIENHCSDAILAQDGDRGIISVGYGDRISFQRGPSLNLAQPVN